MVFLRKRRVIPSRSVHRRGPKYEHEYEQEHQ
jgi:hypothetical protein